MTRTSTTQRPLLALRIEQARREAGLLQREAAELVGCSFRAIQSWESGEREPRGPNLRRLAEATGKPVAWFFEADTNGKAA